MNKLMNFCKRLRLHQTLIALFAGALLLFTTACSGTNAQGANPNNPAVQAGGANNPHKAGGDNYNNLKMSTDPKVNPTKSNSADKQASLAPFSGQLIAATNKESELLYPGAETPEGRVKKESEFPVITDKDFTRAEPGGLIQREPDLGERVQMRVEKAQDAFKEATDFAREKAEESAQRPEFQRNPALGK